MLIPKKHGQGRVGHQETRPRLCRLPECAFSKQRVTRPGRVGQHSLCRVDSKEATGDTAKPCWWTRPLCSHFSGVIIDRLGLDGSMDSRDRDMMMDRLGLDGYIDSPNRDIGRERSDEGRMLKSPEEDRPHPFDVDRASTTLWEVVVEDESNDEVRVVEYPKKKERMMRVTLKKVMKKVHWKGQLRDAINLPWLTF
ncbi:hypothetical protein ACLOJK_004231 [Asimina triloba]